MQNLVSGIVVADPPVPREEHQARRDDVRADSTFLELFEDIATFPKESVALVLEGQGLPEDPAGSLSLGALCVAHGLVELLGGDRRPVTLGVLQRMAAFRMLQRVARP